ncbi:hypothetical protein LCGC14_2730520, partial [marine sediment metagenome]
MLALAVCSAAWAQPTTRPAPKPPAGPKAVAVVIAGVGGSKAYSRSLLDWTRRFCAVLT